MFLHCNLLFEDPSQPPLKGEEIGVLLFSYFFSCSPSLYGRDGEGLLLEYLLSIHDVDTLLSLLETLTCEIVDDSLFRLHKGRYDCI